MGKRSILSRSKSNLAIEGMDKQSKLMSEVVYEINEIKQKNRDRIAYNKQNLKIGDEVEYKREFWIIESFSTSKNYAKLTFRGKQSILVNLVRINNYE